MALPKYIPKVLYRTSLVRMYYAKYPKTDRTPGPGKPFLETRAWIITDKPVPKIWLNRLERELEWLSFVLKGPASVKFKQKLLTGEIETKYVVKKVKLAYSPNVKYEIAGSEFNREIDWDEAIGRPGTGLNEGNFASTGLPPDEWSFYTVYRYACFFKANGQIKGEYNEAEIRRMEPEAMNDYKVWFKLMLFDEKFRESHVREMMALRGVAWQPGWRVSKPYIWKGRPIITVRDERGRFVKKGFFIGKPIELTEDEMRELGLIA